MGRRQERLKKLEQKGKGKAKSGSGMVGRKNGKAKTDRKVGARWHGKGNMKSSNRRSKQCMLNGKVQRQ